MTPSRKTIGVRCRAFSASNCGASASRRRPRALSRSSSSAGNLSILFKRLADPEDVPIGMPHVHLARVPRMVRWRPGDFDALREAVLMDRVDVVDPDRHPDAFVSRLVAVLAERHFRRALPA